MNAPVDVSNVRIETQRMILRPWQNTDLEDFHAYFGDPAVAPGMGWAVPKDRKESESRFSGYYLSEHESLALYLKADQKVVGEISIQARPWERYPIEIGLKGREFGFGLSSRYWGRGLMPEAVMAVLAYCFQTLNYDFVTCGHFLENDKSRRVIEKCGFHHLFTAAHTIPRTGETHNIATYIMYNPNK